ncbi:hypothetical protein PHISCL_08692 [Aspergillus sclerotialis]|uniref:Lipid droplet-associated hydrolase n=1 Tax=Aspergillus sclerotialis TaxID=2070753 RepID=A0A3A2Z8L8_9EURO|nr:hypothetical protein PHISCL_08692 [Aspergillus sclerotialis]
MHPSKPQITPNTFYHTITSSSNLSNSQITIYFITGNPGLIGYYYPFLSLLSSVLSTLSGTSNDGVSFRIYGRSLAGFEVGNEIEDRNGAKTGDGCHDLEDQICYVQRGLDEVVNGTTDSDLKNPTQKQKVILIGHSVGSYIAMEVLRRHRESQKIERGVSETDEEGGFEIIGGIMLFPTVVDIAKSPSGVKLTKLLSLVPHLALIASFFATIFTVLLPDPILRYLIKGLMGSLPDEVLDTTLAFLKSKQGVKQAIHMGADEMRTITSDKWSDDIWGTATPSTKTDNKVPAAKLFFYFGRNDHWVADQTRDDIIEVRGKMEGKDGPETLVCEDGVPHAFCLRHSGIMARKVGGMIKDILRR